MSRSFKKNLAGGFTNVKNDRVLKDTSNSTLRMKELLELKRIQIGLIDPEDFNIATNPREYVDTWSGRKDGKTFYNRDGSWTEEDIAKELRK
jgi:hypothetical protein